MRPGTAATLLVTAAALGTVRCGSPRTEGAPPAPETAPRRTPGPDALRVFATGETRGHVKPCKCQQGQLGGLARRAAYLAGIARPHDVRIDVGNAAAGVSPLRELRLETTLDALAAMDYQVFVPGELEALIADRLVAERDRRESPAIVTANLVREDGTSPFRAHLELDLPDGRRVAVVGLTQPVRPMPPGWRFVPAREALDRALARIEGADLVVVATSLDAADTAALIAGRPVALALAPSDSEDDAPSTDFGLEDVAPDDPYVAAVARYSTYVRCIDLDAALRPVRTWRAWLGEDVPGLPEAAAVVRRHRERAVALRPTLVPDILRARREAGFVGSAVCAECHADEHAQWSASGHGHAMATLVRESAARDPDCVPCHLVDVPAEGVPDDALAAAGDALGVGCEACHGARGRHVENAMLGIVPPGGAPTWKPREVCTGCHRPPEVRHFDFAEAWPRIRHGSRAPR